MTSTHLIQKGHCCSKYIAITVSMAHANHSCISISFSEYTVHATRFQRGADGLPICVIRKEGEIVEDIEDLGTPDVKLIFSPGAEFNPKIK